MRNKKEIYHNIKWWKFTDYIWDENDLMGLHIKPHPDSEIEEYNPWEINEMNLSGTYPIPIYGELIRDCLDLTIEYSTRAAQGQGSETLKKTKKISDNHFENEKNILLLRQRLKERIFLFVKKYGLLGIFWHKANRVVHQSVYIPNLVKKKKFENSSNNYSYIGNKSKIKPQLDWFMPPYLDYPQEEHLKDKYGYDKFNFDSRGIIEKYIQTKKVPKEYKVDGFYIGHVVERYEKGNWESHLLISDVNEIGENFLKKIKEKEFNDYFLNGEIFPDRMLSSRSIAGVYYNQGNATTGERKIEPSYDEITNEYFVPYSKGCYFFSNNIIKNPLFRVGTRYKVGTGGLRTLYRKNYSECFDDFLEFILKLNMATQLEDLKKDSTKELTKDDDLDSIWTQKYINETLRPFNFSLNNYLDRNLLVSDYSNKNNPYSFTSPSLCGSLANMLLWDVIGGKSMRNCSSPKCKRYYFDPGNKMNCSDRCRQATARQRRKESGNLLPSPNNINA